MARKVFISVLGTGFYEKCIYALNEEKASETRFIQQATLELLTKRDEWTAESKGYILLTEKAKTTNWMVENQQRGKRKGAEIETYIGLKDELNGMNLPFSIDPIDIPDGKNEEEIWQIFERVYSELQEDDTLYFDLTHGFRYLPMLVLVLGNYAKFLKNVKVESITYGNFETRDTSVSPHVAPIIDITPLSALQDWTIAAGDYLLHGTASKLKECSMKTLSPILVETKGQDQSANNLRHIATSLEIFTDNIRFCRGMAIYEGKEAVKIHKLLQGATKDYLKPFKPLFDYIDKTVCCWQEKRVENMLLAAELSANCGNWQSAATLLEEGIVSIFCIRHGIDIDDEKKRDIVNNAFTKKEKILNGKINEYRPSEEAKEKVIDNICQDELITQDFINNYSNSLRRIRNDINHGGMRKFEKPREFKSIKKNLSNCIEFIHRYLLQKNTHSESVATLSPIFINLSNHLSTEWEDNQLAAAKEYGEIVDVPFPHVPPTASSEQLDAAAKEITDKISKKYKSHKITVHVMGEMGLTYRIIRRFTDMCIPCVCSTTERIKTELGDGKHLSEFHFIAFRDYE